MSHSKRSAFLVGMAGVVAGSAIIGFDPKRRSWVTEAQAAPPGTIHLPNLAGTLVVDAASRAEAAQDFGHIVSRTPVAVLRPGNATDIVKLVAFANRHGIKVAGRGEAHSTYREGDLLDRADPTHGVDAVAAHAGTDCI